MKSSESTIRGVILDIDGTLVDSNDAHARAWQETFKTHGFHLPYSPVRHAIGKGKDKLLPELTGVPLESELGERITEDRGKHFRENYLPHLKPFPKAKELVQKMSDLGLKILVASSASKKDLKELLKIIGIEELVEKSTSSDDAENSKPDPDIVEAAVRKSGHQPGELIMLGDTPYDIEASSKAGVPCIAFRCGGWDDQALAEAIAIYDGPEDLLEQFDSSVFSVIQPNRQSA